MMKSPQDLFLFTSSDVLALLSRSKKKILFGAAAGTAIAFGLCLLQPVKYESESTFKENGRTQSGTSNSLTALFMSNTGLVSEGSEAIAIMKSRRLMEPIVLKYDLQGTLIDADEPKWLTRVYKNFKTQYFHLIKRRLPPFPDPEPNLLCCELVYTAEVPIEVTLFFTSDNKFNVYDNFGTLLGEGELGVPFIHTKGNDPFYKNPFSFADFQFTLKLDEENQIKSYFLSNDKTKAHLNSKTFILKFEPLDKVAEEMVSDLHIENDKNDTSLLKLSFRHLNRVLSSRILNSIMEEYQIYLKGEYNRQAETQIAYLNKRQEQSLKQLEQKLQDHAASLSKNALAVGLFDSIQEVQYFTNLHHHYQKKLDTIEIELQRLISFQQDPKLKEEMLKDLSIGDHKDPEILQTISEMRKLRMERNTLSLELQQHPIGNSDALKISLKKQIEELERLQLAIEKIQILQVNLENDEIPTSPPKIFFADSPILLDLWIDKLKEKQEALSKSPESKIEEYQHQWEICKTHCKAYLENIHNLLQVHLNILQERIAHHQQAPSEFKGIDLAMAKELHIHYTKQLDLTQQNIRQYVFLLQQVQDNDFEISSLIPMAKDVITSQIIAKASELTLVLLDQHNHTELEQSRIKEDLALQRVFLTSHFKHYTHLMKLEEDVLKEKIHALKATTLELINHRLSIAENHINDHLNSRTHYLQQEYELINDQQRELHQLMSGLPKKWIGEKLINLYLKQNESAVEEIAKLVESKNISHNLELLQSLPLDAALTPILPRSPHLPLFMALGGLFGALFTTGMVIVKGIKRGLPASIDNLKLIQQYVAGKLSKPSRIKKKQILPNLDLETLRRLVSFLNHFKQQKILKIEERNDKDVVQIKEKKSSIKFVGILGEGRDYSKELATLLAKQGDKVILLNLSYNRNQNDVNEGGLISYLEGKVDFPKVNSFEDCDHIDVEMPCRYYLELLNSEKFKKLLNLLEERYDWVIATSKVLPNSAEALTLLSLFDCYALNIKDETLDSLRPFLSAKEAEARTAFIFS